jgi:RNA polymerase sigma factor (sigma-70 family)
MTKFTSEKIREGLLEKNPDVFRYLYRTYGGKIVAHVRKNSGSDEDAQEIIQTTMLNLWQAVRDGRYRDEGKLDQYVYQLGANAWLEELRRRRNRPQSSLDEATSGALLRDDSEESLQQVQIKEQRLSDMHRALEQMDEPCRSIIQLYHLQEVALQEVALKMNYDYNNLRKRIFDCRGKLRKMMSV